MLDSGTSSRPLSASSADSPASPPINNGPPACAESQAADQDLRSGPADRREKVTLGKRRRAAFTIVQNEPVFLPLWLRYYGRYFDAADLYVLDHDSTDGSTDGLGTRCNLVGVHRDLSFDHAWLNGTVTAFHAFLLRSYEHVLFAECDEIVVANPALFRGLDDYIDRFQDRVARCTGFEVVHYPAKEPALCFDQPVLAQRRYWHASRFYCKPLLSSVPMSWSLGFHEATYFPDLQPDPNLFLVHLHRIDYATCAARHRETAARNWNPSDVEEGRGLQNRLVEGEEAFKTWFFRGLDNSTRERIPEHLKTLL